MRHPLPVTRRAALLGLAGAVTLGRSTLALAHGGGDRRLVVIILRGAMDGMAAVVPYGDPALAGLRAPLLPAPAIGQPGGLQDLGGFFGLHPALAAMGALYRAGDLLPVHAVAGHDRSRSHFEAQDCLESGADHRLSSGWLNRAVLAARRPGVAQPGTVSLGVATPLLLRGPAPVASWAPTHAAAPDPAFLAKIVALSAADRPVHAALVQGIAERDFSARTIAAGQLDRRGFVVLADAAGRLLAAPDGPRVAALEITGWDTHQGQQGALARALGELDSGIAALRAALGPAWADTAVLTVTEFGRTARVNGTNGTDHGTGTAAFVMGGGVAGGRVLADWPGLGQGRLYENRDLAPTRDLRGLAKALLQRQLGLGRAELENVFPESGDVHAETRVFKI